MTKVSIIIVNYNCKVNTLDCLGSLKKLAAGRWQLETLVVDNGSSDGLIAAVKEEFPQVEIVELKENAGFTGGNNAGIKLAMNRGADYILLLNNDTIVSADFLSRLLAAAEKDSQVGITVPKIYFAAGYEFHKDRYKKSERGKVIWYAGGKIDWGNMYGSHRGVDQVDTGQFDEPTETDFATGCCMLVKTEVFKTIGYLDNRLFLYLEDLDFSLRAKREGYQIVYVPRSYIWHKNAGSSGSGSHLHDYYLTRNRLWIGWRYAPWRTKLALFRESLGRLFGGRKWEKIGIRDFYLGKFGRGSYAA
jgi:hypothetical protein